MSIPSIAAAVVFVVSPVHVTLVFAPDHQLPPPVQAAAMAEAAAIWSQHGVVVAAVDPSRTARDGDVELTVVISTAAAPTTAAWQAPLGAVDFDAAGTPARIVTVFIVRLIQLLEDARLWDLSPSQWPRLIRETIVGRAIGRVIAHEIGHVLLQSKEHAPRGLMRAVQRADELVDPARNRYRLP